AILTDFAETHFTTGRFEECAQRINTLLEKPAHPAGIKAALRAIELADLLVLNQAGQVPAKLEALIAQVRRQPTEFKVEWSFNGTRHFIAQNERLATYRAWLGDLFDALAGKDREAILKGLQQARATFKQ
ncbi:MAG: hypothetical protein ACRD2L_22505, partial [Terriglobia bacterium]